MHCQFTSPFRFLFQFPGCFVLKYRRTKGFKLTSVIPNNRQKIEQYVNRQTERLQHPLPRSSTGPCWKLPHDFLPEGTSTFKRPQGGLGKHVGVYLSVWLLIYRTMGVLSSPHTQGIRARGLTAEHLTDNTNWLCI